MKKKVDDKKAADESEEEEEEKKKKAKEAKDKEVEGELEEEAPAGTGDKAKHAKDSAFLVESWQEVISMAEIISPGFQIPTFDAKAQPVKTLDAVCKTRRAVLDLAYNQPELRTHMDTLLHGRQVKDCKCNDVRTIFRSVGGFKARLNNKQNSFDGSAGVGGGIGITRDRKIKSIADLNEANKEGWSA